MSSQGASAFKRSDKIAAKKKFGQHFLVNSGVISKIVAQVEALDSRLGGTRRVVEIGPGPGALTGALLEAGFHVRALEIDRDMVHELRRRFEAKISCGQFAVQELDALAWIRSQPRFGEPQIYVGNLPYNVGTEILFELLVRVPQDFGFCFMLQKEVIDRLRAQPGSKAYGAPSVRMAWLSEIHDVFPVSPGSFQPPPKVQSAVVTFQRKGGSFTGVAIEDPRYQNQDRWLNRFFLQRRKKMSTTCPGLKGTRWGDLRAEQLRPQEWFDSELQQILASFWS